MPIAKVETRVAQSGVVTCIAGAERCEQCYRSEPKRAREAEGPMRKAGESAPMKLRRASRGGGAALKPGPGQVYARLRELIVRGQLAPGARVVETELAIRLGVSRTPLREAMLLLQREGYLETGEGSGAQSRLSVAPLTRTDAGELFTLVGEIEGLAAEATAYLPESRRREVVASLARINREFRNAGRQQPIDHERLFRLDEDFHRCYVEAGGGPRLLRLHDVVKPGAERYERIYFTLLARETEPSYQEHEAIVAAIRAGTPEAARVAVRANWRNAAQRMGHVIEALGSRGSW
jgi:DNA-binding GntR family transcriptional regulator